jgi:isoquinoline 1-oxidoreductase
LTVNGVEHTVENRPDVTLLDVLRDHLRLTGTKYGCGEGECGACTVLLNGAAARACQLPADAGGAAVTTIEGLTAAVVPAAFVAERAMQCGYCTPGMVMCATGLLARNPDPDEAEIREAMGGNICRCGGYPRIVAAVALAAAGRAADLPEDLPEEKDTEGDGWEFRLNLPPDPEMTRGWGWSNPGGARLRIDGTGRATAHVGKVEAGQGNRAALTRLVAAELALSTAAVSLVMGDTDRTPYDFGTVGSRSIPDAGHALRLLAMAARHELLREAAYRWSAEPGGLSVRGGAVCDATGRELAYGDLVRGARTVSVDRDDPMPGAPDGLDEVDDARLRRALAAAATGAKLFPSDLALPGMWHGRVLRRPSYGAVLRSLDTTEAGSREGVIVVEDGDFVGVVARTPADATAALATIRAEWDPVAQPGDAELEAHLRANLTEGAGRDMPVERESGNVDAALAAADVGLSATYTAAYVAHVPMEARVALAQVDADSVTVWVGTQRPFAVRDEVAQALGRPAGSVRIVVPDFGGGFGGKHSGDVAVEAARLASASGQPVRLAWTREEEFRWAYFRPAAVIDVRSAARRDGTLTGWEFTNINSGAASLFTPYQVAHRRERYLPAASPLRQGSYRALAATANHFARESHLDELAAAVGADPVQLRLRLLRDERLRDVLRALAEHLGWPDCPHRTGDVVGIACGLEKEARVATAAEVTVDADGGLHVARLTTAVECGAVVDPDGLRIQVVGATIMGLGGALFEAIHLHDGRVTNASLAGYRVPRFADIPPIDVLVLDRPDLASAGAGETPIVSVAPAIANAIFTATGRRLRSLPLVPDGVVR